MSIMVKRILKVLLLSAALLPSVLLAQIYKQKDAEGRVTFTDKPAAGEAAVEVDARPINNVLPEVAPTPEVVDGSKAKSGDKLLEYKSVEIIYPLNESTITTGESASFEIKAATVPRVRQGHKLNVLMDGASVGTLTATGAVTVNYPDRGEHLLTAQVLDESGAVLLESASVKIYVQKISVNSPKNPNNPKNKPKPKAP